jgi:hypothetical protein
MLTIKTVSLFKIRLNKNSNLLLISGIPINKVENPNIEVTYINNVVVCYLNST